jgi:hypothetical protein
MPRIPNGMRPVVSGYSMDDPGGVMRTEVAGGPARYALEWAGGPQRFGITLVLDADAFMVWSAFYLRVIGKGSISFDMPIDSGSGEADHTCNIVPGSYSAGRAGVTTIVSFAVEAESKLLEMTTADAEGLVDLYNAYGRGSAQILAALAQFATVDSNALDI